MGKKLGAPRKYKYEGKKTVCSIRLSEEEKKDILKKFPSIQAFIQECLRLQKE